MNILDLTLPIKEDKDKTVSIVHDLHLSSAGTEYTGVIYDLKYSSMSGSYIDFPGHIRETDDGSDAMNYPIEKLYRINTSVIHLNRGDGSGGVSAEELENSRQSDLKGGALIINALGEKRFDEIENRSVYLDNSALKWIIDLGIHLLISDIYESQALHGVFLQLFRNGISTVCYPVNLHKITAPEVKTSVFCVAHKNITQLPCRIIAEC